MKRNKLRVIAIVLCLVLTAAMVCSCKSEEQIAEEIKAGETAQYITINYPDEEDKTAITVSGAGEVKLTPDMATVEIGVTTEGEDAAKVQEENSTVMNAVTDALKAGGVAEADIETSYLNFNERYDYEKSVPEITGYIMSNGLSVTIRDIDSVGTVLSAAIAAGATNVGSVQYSISDNSKEYAGALKAAAEDAKTKAVAIAEAMGAELEELPVSVNEISQGSTPVLYRTEFAVAESEPAADAGEVAVSYGELVVSASVEAVYRIK